MGGSAPGPRELPPTGPRHEPPTAANAPWCFKFGAGAPVRASYRPRPAGQCAPAHSCFACKTTISLRLVCSPSQPEARPGPGPRGDPQLAWARRRGRGSKARRSRPAAASVTSRARAGWERAHLRALRPGSEPGAAALPHTHAKKKLSPTPPAALPVATSKGAVYQQTASTSAAHMPSSPQPQMAASGHGAESHRTHTHTHTPAHTHTHTHTHTQSPTNPMHTPVPVARKRHCTKCQSGYKL